MLSKALLDSDSHWLKVGSWSRMQEPHGSERRVCLGLITILLFDATDFLLEQTLDLQTFS